jgi:hypothetical protein
MILKRGFGKTLLSVIDDFVKSPPTALRSTLSHCGVRVSTPHSFGFMRLVSEAFYFVVPFETFYDFISD